MTGSFGLANRAPAQLQAYKRTKERTDVFQGTCEELQSAEAFTKFTKSNSALTRLVVAPTDGPLRARLSDADLETADVQGVADPLGDNATAQLVPSQGRVDQHQDE